MMEAPIPRTAAVGINVLKTTYMKIFEITITHKGENVRGHGPQIGDNE